MGQSNESQLDQKFLQQVRAALNHLYDPDFLRTSGLANSLELTAQFDRAMRLQKILTETIDGLGQAAQAGGSAPERELYELLLFRYVQQFGQDEVAHQFGISVRQLRRKQSAAIYALAAQLWQQRHPPVASAHEALTSTHQTSGASSARVDDVLKTVMQLIKPLAAERRATINWENRAHVTVTLHPVAFQQCLLMALSIAVASAYDHAVNVTCRHADDVLCVDVSWPAEALTRSVDQLGVERIEAIRRLLRESGGSLAFIRDQSPLRIELQFPLSRRLTVLVVEDNPEIIAVIQRFTQQSRFTIQSVTDPEAALATARRIQPELLILDIMMPQTDGLLLLRRLREEPDFAATPIVVCSVLPQVELARALGASDFLRKPFDRRELLAVLERQATRLPR